MNKAYSFLTLYLITMSLLISQTQLKTTEKTKTFYKVPERKIQNVENRKTSDAPKSTEEAVCKSIGLFTGQDSTKPRQVMDNTSGVCEYLKKVCCTNEELKALKNWWQGPTNQIDGKETSRQNERAQKDADIVLFTESIIKLYPELKTISENILARTNFSDDSFCKKTAKEITNFDQSKFAQYITLYEQCSTFVGKMQSTVLCATCDPKMQNAVNLFEGKVLFDQNTLKEFNKGCGALVEFNNKTLFPYSKAVENLTKCNMRTGAKDDIMVDLSIGFEVGMMGNPPNTMGPEGPSKVE